MERYFSAGLADSTRRVYSTGRNRYITFCNQFGLTPTPASENVLCKFVSYLALNNISWTTMKVYLAVVRQCHISKGLGPLPTTEMAKLAQVLRGIRISQAIRTSGAEQKCLPITPELLRRIKAHWQSDGISYDRMMLWAAFTTCFFGFLWSGEVCSKSSLTFQPLEELRLGGHRPQPASRQAASQGLQNRPI